MAHVKTLSCNCFISRLDLILAGRCAQWHQAWPQARAQRLGRALAGCWFKGRAFR